MVSIRKKRLKQELRLVKNHNDEYDDEDEHQDQYLKFNKVSEVRSKARL